MMKAVEIKDGGFNVIEIPKPSPKASEILIKIKYSAIDTALPAVFTKDFTAGFLRNMKVTPVLAGWHFSGTVEDLGEAVPDTNFTTGDAVFGHLQYTPTTTQGAFSEYICVEHDSCAYKLDNVGWDIAAGSATEALTAMQALRDRARLTAGKTVLILGAGGAVGSAAVEIAKVLGASSVTAVCSQKDTGRVQKLGADVVIDRKTDGWQKELGEFDVVFDAPSAYNLMDVAKWLKKGGGFVNTLPMVYDIIFFGWLWTLFQGKSFKTVLCESKKDDLELVSKWLSDRSLHVPIDSEFKVSELADAYKRFGEKDRKGRVVIKVEDGW